MKDPFGSHIKCTSGSISSINPINDPLPMSILIMIHFTICITERIPVLANCKVGFASIYVVLNITTPEPPGKIQSPSVISNFFPAGNKLKAKIFFSQNEHSYHFGNGKNTLAPLPKLNGSYKRLICLE